MKNPLTYHIMRFSRKNQKSHTFKKCSTLIVILHRMSNIFHTFSTGGLGRSLANADQSSTARTVHYTTRWTSTTVGKGNLDLNYQT